MSTHHCPNSPVIQPRNGIVVAPHLIHSLILSIYILSNKQNRRTGFQQQTPHLNYSKQRSQEVKKPREAAEARASLERKTRKYSRRQRGRGTNTKAAAILLASSVIVDTRLGQQIYRYGISTCTPQRMMNEPATVSLLVCKRPALV